jgi:hypothetical protein
MAEETKTTKKPKTRVCAKTQKSMKRISWYYRDGNYFQNKKIYREWKKEKTAAAAEAAAKAAATAAAPAAPAAQA